MAMPRGRPRKGTKPDDAPKHGGWKEIEREMIRSQGLHAPKPSKQKKCSHCGEGVYSRTRDTHVQCAWLAEIEIVETQRAIGRDDHASDGGQGGAHEKGRPPER
jgi:hypothetical protein